MKLASLLPITFGLSIVAGHSQAPDNGVPASEVKEWREVWNPTTGSGWRTKTNEKTGETLSYNPFTSEIWRNRYTGKAEAVLREQWIDDGLEAAKRDAALALTSKTSTDESTAKAAATSLEATAPASTKTARNEPSGSAPSTGRDVAPQTTKQQKGSFIAEMVASGNSYYIKVKTSDGAPIEVTVRGTDGYNKKFTGTGSLSTDVIPKGNAGVSDAIEATDPKTSETQTFKFNF